MASQVYLNGTFTPKLDAKLSVYDHGLLYGDGVWEGMRLRNGVVPRLDDHLMHLFAAAEAVALSLPFTPTEMADTVRSAIASNSRRFGYVRVIVTRGAGTIGLDPRKCEPAVIVDTHVKRVSGRLGLTTATDPDQIETDLRRLLPPEEWTSGSQQLLLHGRYICLARNPQCDQCPIYHDCPWEGKRAR